MTRQLSNEELYARAQRDPRDARYNRGLARARAVQRLIRRHIPEFQQLWDEEARLIGATGGKVQLEPEVCETDEEREARLVAEEIERERLLNETALGLIGLLR